LCKGGLIAAAHGGEKLLHEGGGTAYKHRAYSFASGARA
jgi:hypothetical protein